MSWNFNIIIICLVACLMTSCGNVLHIPATSTKENPKKRQFSRHYLTSNHIDFVKQKYKLNEDLDNLLYELEDVVIQRPDRSIIKGFRKWVYYSNDSVSTRYLYHRQEKKIKAQTKQKKQNGFKKWLHSKLGSAPVFIDTSLTEKTRLSMLRLLNQKAYFDAEVGTKITYKKHKAHVTYSIKTGKPLLIDSVYFSSKDTLLGAILNEISDQSLLKRHQPISLNTILEEKKRITYSIRNKGYFDFTWKYILAEADTINLTNTDNQADKNYQGEPLANVHLDILPYSDTSIQHPRYWVNNVFITPNEVILKPHQTRIIKKDSFFIVDRKIPKRSKILRYKNNPIRLPGDSIIQIFYRGNDTIYKVKRPTYKIQRITFTDRSDIGINDQLVHILLRKKYTPKKRFYIRNKVISNAIDINANEWYNHSYTQSSVKNINNLAVFRFPRIEYVPSRSGKRYELDCLVKMQPGKKQSLGADFEFNNNQTTVTSLGVATNLSYRNKNIFKGAEIFEISAQAGLDLKVTGIDTSSNNLLARWVNLIDINLESNFYIPSFVGPSALERALKMENARTVFSVGYRYLQQSTDFQISSIYGRFGYTWNFGQQHSFVWNPAMINFNLEPTLDPTFEELLNDNNVVLLNSLQATYLIPSMEFSYIYNAPQNKKSWWYLKAYLETAGNLFSALDLIIEPNKPLRIFDVNYSQYIRTELDLRYSYKFNRKHLVISRLLAGIILPYGNSLNSEIPFTKRFTLGGPSSMRAWNLRYIGPGNVASIPNAEFQMGDIRLEWNMEYRFMFNSWIGGAIFSDVGNIWDLKARASNTSFPNQLDRIGHFTSEFYEQLAVGAGFGLRFDLSFFIFRIDFAIQLRDPQGYGIANNGTTQYWNFDPFVLENRNKFIIAIGYPF